MSKLVCPACGRTGPFFIDTLARVLWDFDGVQHGNDWIEGPRMLDHEILDWGAESRVMCHNPECCHTAKVVDFVTVASTLYKIQWDDGYGAQYLTQEQIRSKFASTNLFDRSTWSCHAEDFYVDSLDEVFQEIEANDEYTCDNCTISIADNQTVSIENIPVGGDRRLTLREFIDSERRSTDKNEWKDLGIGEDEAKQYMALRIYNGIYWIAELDDGANDPVHGAPKYTLRLYLNLGPQDEYIKRDNDEGIGLLLTKLYTYARLAWGA